MMIPPPSNAAVAGAAAGDDDAVTAMPPTEDIAGAAVWRQRRLSMMDQEQQRQRSLRTLMTFLMMLLLMEGEEPPHPNNMNKKRKGLRGKHSRTGGDDDTNINVLGGGLNASSVSKRRRGTLDLEVFEARIGQDLALQQVSHNHPRYTNLIEKNQGADVATQVEEWSRQQAEQQKDEFFAASTGGAGSASAAGAAGAGASVVSGAESQPAPALDRLSEADEAESKRHVFHYPWNSTGFYRGTWTRHNATVSPLPTAQALTKSVLDELMVTYSHTHGIAEVVAGSSNVSSYLVKDPTQIEPHVSKLLTLPLSPQASGSTRSAVGAGGDGVRVVILPPQWRMPVRDDHNMTVMQWERMTTDSAGRVYPPPPPHPSATTNVAATSKAERTAASRRTDPLHKVTLSRDDGRVAFQLFSRPIPGMKEISLVDGFVKLYDSVHAGYSTQKDLLLRVRGVHVHSIGRLSLVSSNVDVRRTAFLIEPVTTVAAPQPSENDNKNRRRLLSQLVQEAEPDVDAIRNAALAESDSRTAGKTQAAVNEIEPTSVMQSVESLNLHEGANGGEATPTTVTTGKVPSAKSRSATWPAKEAPDTASKDTLTTPSITESLPAWSNHVIPYPFIRDDADESIRRERTQAYRKMPPREQALEANAASCEFEINLDVQPTEWTIGSWRNLVLRRLKEQRRLDPSQPISPEDESSAADMIPGPTALKERTAHIRSVVAGRHSKSRKKSALQDQALVMTLVGTIHSSNCAFTASLNATALRTDWDKTTSKAVNYSFYMMLVCLAQILVLLRQLLHSQSTSAATRVSLLCVGWQTVLDALLCLAHIYLSLAMQPLFTAFASVAFFKLLIFCVIEMKYMAMIIQARNSSNGGQTSEVLRRQVAMLHLRFYVALLGTFIVACYAGEKYRLAYGLTLYSFWIPQIAYNVYTEAKAPLHKHYIYGMSVTRLVAPLYILAVPKNFLKEVYPDAPTDPWLCQLLVLWVGIQVAVLMAQGKYGARFMIPARFLPPKFDYSRPLPPSMLPPGVLQSATKPTTSEMMDDRHCSSTSHKRDESTHGSNGGTPASTSSSSASSANDTTALLSRHNATATTTRNRIRGKRSAVTREALVAESPSPATATSSTSVGTIVVDSGSASGTTVVAAGDRHLAASHTLDCSICYDAIDVHDRRQYMLAPCDHLFHRDCLLRWMDQKMECPTCRCQLPTA